jgi:hypothetical protein
MSEETNFTKRIAFVEDNTILQILDTDDAVASLVLGNIQKVDITNSTNSSVAKVNDIYDSASDTIISVDSSNSEAQQ